MTFDSFIQRRSLVNPLECPATCGMRKYEHRRRAARRRGVDSSCPLLVKSLRSPGEKCRNVAAARSECAHHVDWSAEDPLRDARRSCGECSIVIGARRRADECLSMWHVRQVARGPREVGSGQALMIVSKATSSGPRPNGGQSLSNQTNSGDTKFAGARQPGFSAIRSMTCTEQSSVRTVVNSNILEERWIISGDRGRSAVTGLKAS